MQDTTGLTTWTYDEAGRALTKTVTGIGLSTFAYDLTAGIDSLMPGYRAEKTTDPLGGVTLKVYDKVDRLVQVTDAGETTQFEYYLNGNRKSVTYPDGSKELYTYNKIGQNTSLVNLKADGTVIDTYSYTYDAAGNQSTKTDAKGITTFTYDKLNRLAEITEPSGIKTTYSYDKAGNRQGEKKYAGASLLQDTSYTYDLANRLTQTETKMSTTSETEKTLYSYDAAGNLNIRNASITT